MSMYLFLSKFLTIYRSYFTKLKLFYFITYPEISYGYKKGASGWSILLPLFYFFQGQILWIKWTAHRARHSSDVQHITSIKIVFYYLRPRCSYSTVYRTHTYESALPFYITQHSHPAHLYIYQAHRIKSMQKNDDHIRWTARLNLFIVIKSSSYYRAYAPHKHNCISRIHMYI